MAVVQNQMLMGIIDSSTEAKASALAAMSRELKMQQRIQELQAALAQVLMQLGQLSWTASSCVTLRSQHMKWLLAAV